MLTLSPTSNPLFFDVETTTTNKGHPFNPINKLISYGYCTGTHVVFQHHSDPDFLRSLHSCIDTADVVVGFNIKFDLHWATRHHVVYTTKTRIWDCSLAEFVISGQTARFISLNEALESYGLPVKIDKVKEDYWDNGIDTDAIPIPILEEYNLHDVHVTKLLYEAQQSIMSDKQKALVWLLGEDLKALQHAEFNGIKWDEDKANSKLVRYKNELLEISQRLSAFLPPIEHGEFNFDSGDHLSCLLYGGVLDFDYFISEESVYKSGRQKGEPYIRNRWFTETIEFPQRFTPIEGTEVKKSVENQDPAHTRIYQTDAPTLSQLKTRSKDNKMLLALLGERAGKIKVVEMIETIQKVAQTRNWQDNILHPQFNQNIAITGRLSSSTPNMQNTPEEIDELLVSRYE